MGNIKNVIPVLLLASVFLLLSAAGVHAAGVSGTVTSDGTTGIPQVSVALFKLSGHVITPIGSGFTNANGDYVIDNITPGTYQVEFRHIGYYSKWYNGKQDITTADPVTVVVDQITSNINGQLTLLTGSISGRVTSDGTHGIAGIIVQLRNAATGFTIQSTSTDANGDYVLTRIASGTYKVYFNALPLKYAKEWYINQPDLASADPVVVTDGATTTGIDAVLASTRPASRIGIFDNGTWYLDANQSWNWNGTPTDILGVFGIGITNAIPVVGDWNGDGRTEIGIYAEGIWYLDMNGNWQWDGTGVDVLGVFGVGLPNAIPVVGDWNGNGKSEIGIYSDGNWYLDKNQSWAWEGSPTDTYGLFGTGLPNVVPVTGDWNGDGATEIGVYSEGNWYLDKNQSWQWDGVPTDTYGLFGTGLPNVIPVTGDWNGDGITKIGVYSDGNWYLDTNASWQWDGTPPDTYGLFGVGLANIVPVTGNFVSGGGTPPPTVPVTGTVYSISDNAPVPYANVVVKAGDGTSGALSTAVADASGEYSILVPAGIPVYFHIEKAGYMPMNSNVTSFTNMVELYGLSIVDEVSAISIITSAGFCAGATSLADPCIAGGKWFGLNTYANYGGYAAGVTVSVVPGATVLYNDGTGDNFTGSATAIPIANPIVPMVVGAGSKAGIFNATGTNGLITKSLYFPLVAGEVAGFSLSGF